MQTLDSILADQPDLDAAGLLAAYNAQAVTYRDVAKAEVVATLDGFGLLGVLALAQFDASLDVVVRAAVAELMTGINALPTLRGTDARVRGLMATAIPALVTAGTITSDVGDAIGAMIVEAVPAVTLDDAARAIRQRDALPTLAAINEYTGTLAAWVESGDGEMPAFGGGE